MKNLFVSCLESRIEDPTTYYGSFQIGPFPKGQGITIANALRRTILSEIPTLGIVSAKLQTISYGPQSDVTSQQSMSDSSEMNKIFSKKNYSYAAHEYSILEGVKESTLDILLNLQKVVFSSEEFFDSTQVILVNMQGPGVLKASDLRLPPGLMVVNPEEYIASLTSNAVLQGKLFISFGKKENAFSKVVNAEPGVLNLQPTFFPIKKVNYKIEMDEIHPEKELINLEIWTNGSLQPRTALESGISTLIRIFSKLETNFNLFDQLISGKITTENQKPQFSFSTEENPNLIYGERKGKSDEMEDSIAISETLSSSFSEKGFITDTNLDEFSVLNQDENTDDLALGTENNEPKLEQFVQDKGTKTNFSLLPIKRRLSRLDIGNLKLSLQLYSYLKTQKIHSVQDILVNSKQLEQKLGKSNPLLLEEFNQILRPFEFEQFN
jgi:DNA-directed RNA polymerase subunit alpha